ncbi:MAG: hydrogenase maturation protease [Tepidisphaeraceae bacterium]|jgi:hydrogenase maturation protease
MPSNATESPVLIIGYGNALRGDDGAGPEAARRLKASLPRRWASVLTAHQLLPEMAEPLSRAQWAIFIDADCRLQPGRIRRRRVRIVQPTVADAAHQQGPEGILRLARDLYGRCPRALLYGVGAASFAYEQALSPPVRAALPRVVRDVMRVVRRASAGLAWRLPGARRGKRECRHA